MMLVPKAAQMAQEADFLKQEEISGCRTTDKVVAKDIGAVMDAQVHLTTFFSLFSICWKACPTVELISKPETTIKITYHDLFQQC